MSRKLLTGIRCILFPERDIETGFSYFGARYYDSGLGIWLSVDPMSGKYPGLSPYTYSGNNPVMLIDPNGMELDWFQNEKTGEILYSRELGKNDAKGIGENWNWLGEDNMFGMAPHDIYNSQYSDGGATSDVLSFGLGENSKSFMDAMGYDFKPKEVIATVTERQQIISEPHGPIYLNDKNESLYPVLSRTYAKKGAIGSYTVLKEEVYDKNMPLISIKTTKQHRMYDYSKTAQKIIAFQ